MGTDFTDVEAAFFTAGDQLAELATSYLSYEAVRATWWQRLLGQAAWPQLHAEPGDDGYYDAVEVVAGGPT
jgi:hypothetical protein